MNGTIAARNGIVIPEHLDERIHAMASALATLSQAGAAPRFGDDDGGRLFDPSRNRSEHLQDPLSTATVLFGDGELKSAAPGLCEETLWLLGPESAAAFDAIPAAAPRRRAWPSGPRGIHIMACPGHTGEPVFCGWRTARLAFRGPRGMPMG